MNKQSTLKIGVIGAGQWGTAVSILASKNTHDVTLYDRSPEVVENLKKTRTNPHFLPGVNLPAQLNYTNDLCSLCSTSDILFLIIPSKAVRSVAKQLKTLVKKDQLLVHGTKGLEPETYKRMSEVLAEETQLQHIGAISGPNLALELAKGLPGATVIASQSKQVIDTTQLALASSQFRVYGNSDLVGVEWAGTLKNVLAIASGIVNELGYGTNMVSMLITRGVTEMSRMINATGGSSLSLLGLAGIGDIITTCTSPLSRNFRAGQMLARGKSKDQIEAELAMTVEGLGTIKIVQELSQKKNIELPITAALKKIVFENYPIKEALKELMERPQTHEFQIK